MLKILKHHQHMTGQKTAKSENKEKFTSRERRRVETSRKFLLIPRGHYGLRRCQDEFWSPSGPRTGDLLSHFWVKKGSKKRAVFYIRLPQNSIPLKSLKNFQRPSNTIYLVPTNFFVKSIMPILFSGGVEVLALFEDFVAKSKEG